MHLRCLPLLLLSSIVTANVEKTIFVAPPETTLPNSGPSLDNLCLDSVAPPRAKLRTLLPVQFPYDNNPRGLHSWYLLKDLKAGQRYEVRICWSATQPTDFHLSTFPLETVFNSNTLITSLAAYAEQRQSEACPIVEHPKHPSASAIKGSLLLLKIEAAADFFSSDNHLMTKPPPVLVDIILDPYLFNVIPQSLLPTGVYIVIVAILSYYLSASVFRWILGQRGMSKDKET